MLLDTNWRFHLGDLENAFEKNHADADWRQVTLPHDWSVEYPKDRNCSSGTGYVIGGTAWYRKHFSLPKQAKGNKFFLCFDGVYKNSQVWINGYYLGKRPNGYISFRYDVTDFLNFDDSEDTAASDASRSSAENVIAVKVTHEDIADSRWFTGSGITRKVTLQQFGEVYPQEYGIFFQTPNVCADCAEIVIDNELVLSELVPENTAEVTVASTLFDGECAVALFETAAILTKGMPQTVTTSGTLASPRLWSPENPALYTLRTNVLLSDGKSVTVDEQKVGIRSIRFDADTGFFLNEKPAVFKGVCLHHDGGALGAAMTRGAWRRRLSKLKAMGCNAIRTSHNPHANELYELCDEMGFFVMDEAFDEWEGCKNKWWRGHNVYPPKHEGYAYDFPEWHERDLTAQVRRDRNHPSIVLFSIGNEIDYPNDPYNHPSFQTMTGNNDANKPEEERRFNADRPNMERLTVISKKLAEIVKQSDPTRPVTAAVAFPELSANLGYIDHLDVVGYNYKEHLYERDHLRFPDKPFVGSENSPSYEAWRWVKKLPYISGQFLWIGIDYLGECGGWPSHTHGSGNLSTAGFEKSRYYSRQSWWSEEPVIHICTNRKNDDLGEWKMMHDSWNYVPGEEIEVRCYTNCKNPVLLLNDTPVKTPAGYVEELGFYRWFVPFEPGKITVGASVKMNPDSVLSPSDLVPYEYFPYHFNHVSVMDKERGTTDNLPIMNPDTGNAAASLYHTDTDIHGLPVLGVLCHTLETVGAPTQIGMKVASDEDIIQIEINVLDASGRRVATDQSRIYVHIDGDCEYLGLDNGDVHDVTDYRSNFRNALEGRLMLYLRKKGEGSVTVTAGSPYLRHYSLSV